MSVVTISQLPQSTPLVGDELIPIVQGGTTKQTSVGTISALNELEIAANTASIYPYTTDIELGSLPLSADITTTRNLYSITTGSGYYNNTKLHSIYIGSNVTSIGVDSFRGADNLRDVIIALGADALPIDEIELVATESGGGSSSIASGTYSQFRTNLGKPQYRKVDDSIPIGDIFWGLRAGATTNAWNIQIYTNGVYAESTEDVATPDLVTNWTILNPAQGYVYSTTHNITAVDISSVGGSGSGFDIQTSAFRDLQNLQKVILPSNLENLQAQAFRGCANLSNIVLPRNAPLQSIGNGAFRDCIFSSINIPDSVQTLHTDVFRDCTNLTSITLPESLNTLWHQVFLNNTSLARIECLALNPPARAGVIGTSPFVNVATSEIYIRPEAEVNWGSTYEGLTVVVDPNL